MNASAIAKRQENWTGMYSKGLKNQIGQHLVNLCESNKLETQVVFHIILNYPGNFFFLKERVTKLKIVAKNEQFLCTFVSRTKHTLEGHEI